jgi:hypothetical protein
MKPIAWYLACTTLIVAVAPRVEAGFIPSDLIGETVIDRAADIQKIQKVLETKMVSERLQRLGFSNEEIYSKLSQLSDRQIHEIALNLDDLKVGGDAVAVVIVILVVVALVLLVLHLSGHKVIVAK